MTHRYMAETTTAKAIRSVPQQGTLPAEVIYRIVSYLVASFLDDLLDGSLALDVDMDSQVGRNEVCL